MIYLRREGELIRDGRLGLGWFHGPRVYWRRGDTITYAAVCWLHQGWQFWRWPYWQTVAHGNPG